MNRNNWKTIRVLSTLFLAALLAGAASLSALTPQSSTAAPTVDRAVSAVAAGAVEKALPRLRGVAPDEKLRTLRWMLSAGDDRRLVFLFDDLREARQEPIERRAATARQRLEELATDLEKAGHKAPAPAAAVARIDPNAPPPNYFPPSLIQDLERQKNDPEAARALEESRRTSPRGLRPPGR
ncbi:MAG: hypothetical protein QOF89_2843 [Acidobacteriota bacterium]|jgi:hypothetical protein|nr:hypothetical protein [Acidobacteriota bacterium]